MIPINPSIPVSVVWLVKPQKWAYAWVSNGLPHEMGLYLWVKKCRHRVCCPWSRNKIIFPLEGEEGQDVIGIDSNSPVKHALNQYALCGKKKSVRIQIQSWIRGGKMIVYHDKWMCWGGVRKTKIKNKDRWWRWRWRWWYVKYFVINYTVYAELYSLRRAIQFM